jgi:hypothetical protein
LRQADRMRHFPVRQADLSGIHVNLGPPGHGERQ